MNFAQYLATPVKPLFDEVRSLEGNHHAKLKEKTISRWKEVLANGPLTTVEIQEKLGYKSISHTVKKMKERGLIECVGQVKLGMTYAKRWKWIDTDAKPVKLSKRTNNKTFFEIID